MFHSQVFTHKRTLLAVTLAIFMSRHELPAQVQEAAAADSITMYWTGALEIGAIRLRLRLDIETDESGAHTGALVSIDQGNVRIPLDSLTVTDQELEFSVQQLGIEFSGKLNPQEAAYEGTFTQMGQAFDLKLTRVDDLQATLPKRPQMPQEPFPYEIRGVRFTNPQAENVTLAGSLTIPQSQADEAFPAVILVTGSGPQDRDETLMGHKPFWVIADHLSRNGIAVLRYDDRGIGESTGDFSTGTTADFATDAAAALDFLTTVPEIDAERIGVIGHSEGGIIAAMLAASDKPPKHVVMLAGPGLPGDQIIISQSAALAERSGIADEDEELRREAIDMVKAGKSLEELREYVEKYLEGREAKRGSQQVSESADGKGVDQARRTALITGMTQLASPWVRYFLVHDPRDDLGRVKCPMYALIGENDLQVLPDLNLPEIEKSLAKSGIRGHRVERLAGLNHLFQTSTTGLPSEYGTIEETIAPDVLQRLVRWVKEH